MEYNFSYDILEKKIQLIKNDVENLCLVVNQLMTKDTDPRKDSFSSVVDRFIEEEPIPYMVEYSRRDSDSSYYTAVSDLSTDTFISAIENVVENSLQSLYDTSQSKINETMKKNVSFASNVTVLQILHRKCKKGKVKTKINTVKNRIINYLYQEKFIIKYNWQKIKNNILKYKTIKSTINEYHHKDDESCFFEKILEERKNKKNTINWQTFFNENVDNFVLETDIDHDCIPPVSRHCLFPQTDLSTPILKRKSYPKSIENPVEKIKVKKEIKNKNIIEPKNLNLPQNEQQIQLPNDNTLFQYLVSKAQYPIQLKVAHSIAKLNIPVWYQSSLIT